MVKFQQIYNEQQEKAISEEFKRLKGHCYLEHAGATLYSEKQINNIASQLSTNLYANPHARNHSSKTTDDAIDIVRFEILSHFNTNPDEYSVIFTAGATAALKLVGESFQYKNNGCFVYLQDNHTSVLGMRQYAETSKCLKLDEAIEIFSKDHHFSGYSETDLSHSLFVYPAQSNFSGTKYPLLWLSKVDNLNCLINKTSRWAVMLDAASYLSTNPLDLSRYKPDFVAVSFYKIFGYPTGLGALLVKNTSCDLLEKKYYGGGTVLMALSLENTVVPRNILHERFEDGSLPFLSILSIKEGFDTIKRFNLNFDLISKHTFSLAQYVYKNLITYHHSNGQPLCIFYHNTTFDNHHYQGGIVNFNLYRDNGDYIGYSEILHFANLYNIHLRTGCCCNPGACQDFLNLSSNDVRRHFEAGHVCGDQHDLVDNYPTGSVRISFGYMSTKQDAERFLDMIKDCFVTKPILIKPPDGLNCNKRIYKTFDDFNGTTRIIENCLKLEQIFLYPIKSCGAYLIQTKWPLISTGLKYDRQWMIVNSMGVCVTQKLNKNLCLIKPLIDTDGNLLILTYPQHKDFSIALDYETDSIKQASLCQSKVCGDNVQGWDCGDGVAEWLQNCLKMPGLRLLRQYNNNNNKNEITTNRKSKNDDFQLSLVNKAQFLLINKTTVEWLRDRVESDDFQEDINTTIHRFRPNFVVNLNEPFEENYYEYFNFNGIKFKVSGQCTRCQMICIDQLTGEISKEPLRTLSREFKGKISFGIYLNRNEINENAYLSVDK